jgi:hypothetical protein
MKSLWLAEFHRQWLAARGRHSSPRSRSFVRDWVKLLDDAGIKRAEDVDTAEREVGLFEKSGRFVLKRHRYRNYIIERIVLPLESEKWLHDLFGSISGGELLETSLRHVEDAALWKHPVDPLRWSEWCSEVARSFAAGRRIRPFNWRSPSCVREILTLAHGLTSRRWEEGRLIREASSELKLGSKLLEERRRVAEAVLSSFFGKPTALESLGIVERENSVQFAGRLMLHFTDGSFETIEKLRATYHLTSDLDRAVRIETTADRVLLVENSKTTLRRLAELNESGDTLLVACSFPTGGIKRLLDLLPQGLPLYHFGDTDPAGFHILSKVRLAAKRPVIPFLMHKRESGVVVPLTGHDRKILPSLLADPLLEDVREILLAIQESEDKGDFEQEGIGVPTVRKWPFYSQLV